MLNVGIVGCGKVAQQVHLPILSQSSMAKVIALCDLSENHLQAAKKFAPDARLYESYSQLASAPEIDVVFICAPNNLHGEIASAALNNEKHIYLEKPIDITFEQARDLVLCAHSAQQNAAMGLNYRYNRVYSLMRDSIRDGSVGSLRYVRTTFSCTEGSKPEWKMQRSTGGGVLLDLASHHVDMLRFIFNCEIQDVFCRVQSHSSPNDTASLSMALSNGCLAESIFSFSSLDQDSIEIFGSKGSLAANRYQQTRPKFTKASPCRLTALSETTRDLLNIPYRVEKLRSVLHEPSYKLCIESFLRSIINKSAPTPDLLDGLRSLEVILAAEQSVISGKNEKVIQWDMQPDVKPVTTSTA